MHFASLGLNGAFICEPEILSPYHLSAVGKNVLHGVNICCITEPEPVCRKSWVCALCGAQEGMVITVVRGYYQSHPLLAPKLFPDPTSGWASSPHCPHTELRSGGCQLLAVSIVFLVPASKSSIRGHLQEGRDFFAGEGGAMVWGNPVFIWVDQ